MIGSELILASASPRRKQLLRQLGITFKIMPQNIVERPELGEAPEKFVERMADEKAMSALGNLMGNNIVVLASDTIIVCDGRVLGKPKNKSEGIKMLRSLSDKSHRVLSAVTLASSTRQKSVLSDTTVIFRDISEIEAEYYWESGEPAGKAGGYAIQGVGSVFVQSIKGSYSGVMGLPLFETAQLFREFGIQYWRPMQDMGNE